MNYSIFIVKILTKPIQSFFSDNTSVVETTVQFSPIRKKKKETFDEFRLSVWGNVGNDLSKYYRIGDYIIIEGFLSLRSLSDEKIDKEPEFTVLKLYPFLLSDDDFIE